VKKPFDKVIGIIGGGQLGKMLIESASPWNVSFAVLDKEDAPAMMLADIRIPGALTDGEAIKILADNCDILTYEIEHINVEVLAEIEKMGKPVFPSPGILHLIRDKGLQKQFYAAHNLPTAPFVLVDGEMSWTAALENWEDEYVVVKSRMEGYDGKGVCILKKDRLLSGERPFPGPCLLEKMIHNATELAVIIARDRRGDTAIYPVIEMAFDTESNLVEQLFSPANISLSIEEQAKNIAVQAVEAFGGIGLFAVEMFVSDSGELYINEIAPRPHNSGHHTIEACYTSQYEQLIRILLGLPLGSTALIQPAVMLNILGPKDIEGDYMVSGTDEVLSIPGVYLHFYNKKTTRYKRKMGHCTILADTLAEAFSKAKIVRKLLRLSAVS